MQIRIGRDARRHIAGAGGVLTLEARAKTGGCLIKIHLHAQAGKPEEPALFSDIAVGQVRVFVRGLIELPDGTLRPSDAALPGRIRVREQDGALLAEAA